MKYVGIKRNFPRLHIIYIHINHINRLWIIVCDIQCCNFDRWRKIFVAKYITTQKDFTNVTCHII